jgi:hypothetical protein
MPAYDHLPLVRLPQRFERRKSGGGVSPTRDYGTHSRKLQQDVEATIAAHKRRAPPEFVNPSLIMRVRMDGMTMEETWENLGMTLLGSDDDRSMVLFASDQELTQFQEQLAAYARGVPQGKKAPSYSGFINRVLSISPLEPRDRIGIRFREEGMTEVDDFEVGRTYLIDIELWDFGSRDIRERKLDEIATYIELRGGEVFERYVGPSITMLRARIDGGVFSSILGVPEIASVDLPPEPDAIIGDSLNTPLSDVGEPSSVPEDAPVVGVIDSGVNDHPLLLDVLVGAIGVPAALGTNDGWGHGTGVGGAVLYGDLRSQFSSPTLTRQARIASARVLNDSGNFDERRLVPSQMKEALTALHRDYGCRVFVIAIGDRRPYEANKVGPWAATLDEIARELDAVIVIAAGNRSPRSGTRIEQAVTEYPTYLLEAANRLCEPASAVNAVTVGAIAHGPGLSADHAEYLSIRPITSAFEPAPFTRAGPGVGGVIKPDFVDFGGTLVFDALTNRLRPYLGDTYPAAGVVALHHDFGTRLFKSASGTSYAAPLVAGKAAKILTRFPRASANLVRALLSNAARVPEEATSRIAPLGANAVRSVCGNGLVDVERACNSDDHRVVFFAEDELDLDHFAVYRIPIPDLFQDGGRRTIRISLAYDPPVRHTRADYVGVGMDFRLVRGCDSDFVFEHYRRRTKEDGAHPELANKYQCKLDPGPRERERGTLQTASVTFTRSTAQYGDSYYLVVRCLSGWASLARQRFAIVVELEHRAEVKLYARLRVRQRV